MAGRGPVIFLGLAMMVALVTSLLVYQWLNAKAVEPEQKEVVEVETTGVVVANKDLVWGMTLDEDMVRSVPQTSQDLPEGHFSDPEQLIGRVILTNVKRNEPILESKLAPIGASGGVASIMQPEKRAMAVKVNEVVGVAGFVQPGDRVDVIATFKRSSKSRDKVTKTVLENTLVLATGTEMERKEKDAKPNKVRVITLEVTPNEAEKLALAANEGQVTLALRNPVNVGTVLTKGATLRSLLSSYQAVEVKHVVRKGRKVRRPIERVEIIKGNEKKTLKF